MMYSDYYDDDSHSEGCDEVDFAGPVQAQYSFPPAVIGTAKQHVDDSSETYFISASQQFQSLTISGEQKSSCITTEAQPVAKEARTVVKEAPPVVKLTPTQLTREQKQEQICELRIRCFNKNEDGDTYLHLSTIYEIPEDVRKLIFLAENVRVIDDTNNLYQTALILAVLVRNATITRMLVCAGADPLKVDMRGNTALHIACELKEAEIIENLVKELISEERQQWMDVLPYRSDRKPLKDAMNATNYRGFTPVHIAYFSNHKEGLLILLSYGGDINVMDQCSRKTVLHFAIEDQRLEMVQFLVEQCGADINAKNSSESTPLDVANYCRNSPVIEYLEKRGAKLNMYNSDSSRDDDDNDDESDGMDLSDEDYDDITFNNSRTMVA